MTESTPEPGAGLALLAGGPALAAHPAAPRRLLWQRLLPVAILAGFALVFAILYGDRLWPATPVRVSRVVALEQGDAGAVPPAAPPVPTSAEPADAPVLFQASGWIEPDPLPVKATALTDGVIDQVHVLEGQPVAAGDLIATLIDADAKLALARAREELATEHHAREAHCAGIPAATRRIEAATARAAADQALLGRARDQLDRLDSVKSGAVSTTDLIEARFAVDRLAALADESVAKIDELKAELARIEHEVPMLEARTAAAQARVAEAELALARTRITAPVSGRVLRLLAAPGMKRMLGMDDLDSATVAILYQPEHLQVRVDVPLADAAGLSVGQRARVRCSLLPDTVFHGEVTRIVGEADIQRNTLQAKVRLAKPVPQLRPDMLCRVEFVAGPALPGARARAGHPAALTLFVPAAALVDDATAVWVCDPETRRVSRRQITAGPLHRDGHRQVADGLRPGEWVVLEPVGLTEQRRVNPQHDAS
jgi:RND family efflux transporter MFP subunit